VDINIPDLNGLDFVKSLNLHPMIIFGYADLLKAANKALKLSGAAKMEQDGDICEDSESIKIYRKHE